MVKKEDRVFLIVALFVVLLDQVSKWWVQANNLTMNLFGDWASLRYSINYGAGFGILQGKTSLLIFVSVFVIGTILYYHERFVKEYGIPMALVLGGTIGNLIDRLTFQYVRDFIAVWIWPSFNIADSAITIGVLWIVWKELFPRRKI